MHCPIVGYVHTYIFFIASTALNVVLLARILRYPEVDVAIKYDHARDHAAGFDDVMLLKVTFLSL